MGGIVTASGNTYLPFLKQPMLIYKAIDSEQIKRAFNRAEEKELQIGIYFEPLFATMTHEDNLKETASHTDDEQNLVGIIFTAKKKVNRPWMS
jgi:hypothetical protein